MKTCSVLGTICLCLLLVSIPASKSGETSKDTIGKVFKTLERIYIEPEKVKKINRDELPEDEEEALEEIFNQLDRHSRYRLAPPPWKVPFSCSELIAANEAIRLSLQGRIITVKSEGEKVHIGYLTLKSFPLCTGEQFFKLLGSIEAGVQGLVLDLRGNGGGLIGEAVKVAAAFLPKGKIITTLKSRKGAIEEIYYSISAKPVNLPLAVLINEKTASAAEIVAAALKYHGAATLIGNQTFGKTVFQTVVPVDKYFLEVTTGTVHQAGGEGFEWGITPDIVVLPKKDEDVQFKAAVNFLVSALK